MTSPLKLSVAMATCNGERHLQAQLDSLLAQSRRPDELVISDDASTDGTAASIARFAARAPFEVVVRSNAERLGYIANFEQAVGACTGDIVFLADQDDVWRPDKLARHDAVYRDRPEVGGVFSDAALVDGDLRPLGLQLWRHLGLSARRQVRFRAGRGLDLLIKRGFCYGMLLSFRARYRDILAPFPAVFPHDEWIMLVLSTVAQIELIAEPLVDYRQHSAQAIGTGLVRPATVPSAPAVAHDPFGIATGLARLDALAARLQRCADDGGAALLRRDCFRVIAGRRRYLERRRRLPSEHRLRRMIDIARSLLGGDYLRYGTYPKSDLLADLRAVSRKG